MNSISGHGSRGVCASCLGISYRRSLNPETMELEVHSRIIHPSVALVSARGGKWWHTPFSFWVLPSTLNIKAPSFVRVLQAHSSFNFLHIVQHHPQCQSLNQENTTLTSVSMALCILIHPIHRNRYVLDMRVSDFVQSTHYCTGLVCQAHRWEHLYPPGFKRAIPGRGTWRDCHN